jgi:hypothetical protein
MTVLAVCRHLSWIIARGGKVQSSAPNQTKETIDIIILDLDTLRRVKLFS